MSSTPLQRAIHQYSVLTADHQAEAAREVVTSGRLGAIGGTKVAELEEQAASHLQRAEAVATSSATMGLELVLRGLGVEPGDEVIIPELAWISVGGAAWAIGATVRVAPVTEHLTPTWAEIEPQLTPHTKVVIMAHPRGMPAPGITRVTDNLARRGIALVEDCAQAWGVHAETRPAGGHGTAAVFSTQAHKLIASGEGGLVVADDSRLLTRMRALAGDTRVPTSKPSWRLNYRMSEVCAALALPQLERLDELCASLRVLQAGMIHALGAATGTRAVLPQHVGASNGSTVGIWTDDPTLTGQAVRSLHARGLRTWHPDRGDPHAAAAWPVQPDRPRIDLRRYLDVAVPWLPPADHSEFLALAEDAMRGLAQTTTDMAAGARG